MSATMAVEQDPLQPSSSSSTPRLVGPDGLTNKERRLAKQAEKRKRAQGEEVESSEAVKVDGDEKVPSVVKSEADVVADDEEEEVEAISHKERRKRRKLEKKGLLPNSQHAANGDGDESATVPPPPSSSSINALPPRSAHALWVGNMNFMTSSQRLQSWFEEKGISGISRVHMPKGAKKFEQNKG